MDGKLCITVKIYWNGTSKNVIGKKVKELRIGQGLTQKQLAQRLQLQGYEFTDLTILRIENGIRFVPDYEVCALARVLGVTCCELLRQPCRDAREQPCAAVHAKKRER